MTKYRATFQVLLEMDFDTTDCNPTVEAVKRLHEVFPKGCQIKLQNLSKKLGPAHKEILGEFLLDDVLPFAAPDAGKKEYSARGETWLVNMDSMRYLLFQQNTSCVACGLKGEKFLLEKMPRDKTPHFNLYGVEDGQLVMLTKDHVIPSSVGGGNGLDNYQTLCTVCNQLKANAELLPAEIAEMRKVYNSRKLTMSKRQLSALMEHMRQEFVAKREDCTEAALASGTQETL